MTTDTRMVTAAQDNAAAVMERVIVAGDLSRLQPADRVAYYQAVCESVGLNPLTQPLEYITLNGKLTLYAKKGATDQVRSLRGISIDSVERDTSDPDYATWVVMGRDSTGRVDTEIGSVSIKGLAGEARANAIMKALTKGKRRLTLSLAGLGFLDETEVETIPSARPVDVQTGEVRGQLPPRSTAAQIAERRAAITSAPVAVAEAPQGAEDAQPPRSAPATEPSPEPTHSDSGEGDVVEGEAVEVASARVQCDGFSEELGRCRRMQGHEEGHKNEKGVWPR